MRRFALLVLCSIAASACAQTSSWLDQPLTDWNATLASVPMAPPGANKSEDWDLCGGNIRKPSGANDEAVVAHGWRLFGQPRTFEKLSVIQAMTGVDHTCRPLGFQAFMFQGKRFLGTLAPIPMNARTDGALDGMVFPSASHITIDAHGYVVQAYFERYAKEDATCCASGVTRVSYLLAGPPKQPHVAASAVLTGKTPGN